MTESRASYRQGLAFAALSFLTMIVVGVGGAVAIARVYGIHVVGQFALVYAPTGTVWWLSSMKEQAALVRELASLPPRAPRITGLFAAVFTFSSGLTLIASGVAAGLSYLLFHGPVEQPDLWLPACVTLACYALFVNPAWNLDAIFSSFLAGRDLYWIRVHQATLNLTLGIVLGLEWPTVWSLVAAFGLSSATSLVHRIVAVRRYMRYSVPRSEIRAGFSALPGILRFGIRVTPGMIFQGISNEVATWVLGVMSTVAAVGAYNRAWTLGRRFQELNWRIAEMLLPTLALRWGEGDKRGFHAVLIDTLRYSAAGMLLIGAAGGGAAEGIMELFGGGFDQAGTALAIILLMPALVTLSTLQAQALVAQDRPLATTYAEGGRVVATIIFTVALVPPLGVTGAALAMIIGCAVDLLWKSHLVFGRMTARVRSLWPLRGGVACVAAYGAGLAVARLIDSQIDGFAGVAVALAGGTISYVAALIAVGGLTDSDRRRIADLKQRMRTRGSTPRKPTIVDNASA
jgi:O-antigen/teichoic acid export membrane protein